MNVNICMLKQTRAEKSVGVWEFFIYLYLSLSVGSLVAVFITKGLSAVIQPLQEEGETRYHIKHKGGTF